MKRTLDADLDEKCLREAQHYLQTLMSGDTTITPCQLHEEVNGEEDDEKRAAFGERLDYMLRRIVERGVSAVRGELQTCYDRPIKIHRLIAAETGEEIGSEEDDPAKRPYDPSMGRSEGPREDLN